jgi:hypothetical protein
MTIKKIGFLFSTIGFALFLCGIFFNTITSQKELVGFVEKQTVTEINQESFEFNYIVKIKNNSILPIRICGGQLNWCNQTGCYRIMSPFPIVLQPKQEISVTVVVTPRGNSISETEITLYADGKGLNGLTPFVIKLPAMFR